MSTLGSCFGCSLQIIFKSFGWEYTHGDVAKLSRNVNTRHRVTRNEWPRLALETRPFFFCTFELVPVKKQGRIQGGESWMALVKQSCSDACSDEAWCGPLALTL
jgi:hypothetical protein